MTQSQECKIQVIRTPQKHTAQHRKSLAGGIFVEITLWVSYKKNRNLNTYGIKITVLNGGVVGSLYEPFCIEFVWLPIGGGEGS